MVEGFRGASGSNVILVSTMVVVPAMGLLRRKSHFVVSYDGAMNTVCWTGYHAPAMELE